MWVTLLQIVRNKDLASSSQVMTVYYMDYQGSTQEQERIPVAKELKSWEKSEVNLRLEQPGCLSRHSNRGRGPVVSSCPLQHCSTFRGDSAILVCLFELLLPLPGSCYFALQMPSNRQPCQDCCPFKRQLLLGIPPILNPVSCSEGAELGWPCILVCPRQSHLTPVILVSLTAPLSLSKVFGLYYSLCGYSMQNRTVPKSMTCVGRKMPAGGQVLAFTPTICPVQ